MREIIINRPKRFECSAATLKIEVNGADVDKVKNNQRCVLQVDDGPQEIRVHGGWFQGKIFQDRIRIPAGRESYQLQVDFISSRNTYVPLLRPYGGEFVKDDSRLIVLMGATFARLLLDEKVREGLRKLTGAQLRLVVDQPEWRVLICQGSTAKELYRSEYSRIIGGLSAAVVNAVENMDLKSPEGRAKICDKVLSDYACLPGYERIGADGLIFRG